MMGMGGGGGQGGHMQTCPLCRGKGAVPPEVAAQVAPAAPGGDPIAALTQAMMSAPKGGGRGGGHGGHGGM
jgi:hypothetical protein